MAITKHDSYDLRVMKLDAQLKASVTEIEKHNKEHPAESSIVPKANLHKLLVR